MSVIEHYLDLFDKDFTIHQRRRRMTDKDVKTPAVAVDPLSALVKSQPTRKTAKETTKSGWSDKVLLQKGFYIGKPASEWNRLDLRKYVARQYNVRWGDTLPYNDQHALINEIIAKIEHFLHTQTLQEGYPILKEYFDFFIEKYVQAAAAEHGGMGWRKFSYNKYLFDFVKQWKAAREIPDTKPKAATLEIKAPIPVFSLEQIETAYKRSPTVLIREFGIIVTINYLLMKRKQSLDKSLAYVRNATGKIISSQSDMKDVFMATERYKPYPKWLAFTDVDTVLDELASKCNLPRPAVVFSEDNMAFEFLRNIG